MRHYGKFYIDGAWVEGAGAARFTLLNPASEEPFATIAMGVAADVERAVSAARRAFPGFSATTKAERIALLESVIQAYEKRVPELRTAVAEEMGTPVSTTVQVTGPIDHFKQAIITLRDYDFERKLGSANVRREPIGVCGLISPWNWPIQTPAMKLAYALAAGCTSVLKPSEYSSTSAVILAEVMHDAGVPKGVVNLVLGDGPVVGNAIACHADVDFVSFTGSTRAGIEVARAAAPTVKRVAQELGGKSANIVLPDADMEAAARWNVGRGMFNAGQSCHAPSRMLVHESQMEKAIGYLADEARKLKAGPPLDPMTTLGPLVNQAQYESVQRYIQFGIDEGARLVTGGPGRPDGIAKGYFVKPTIFADVRPGMRIAKDEIFGPVLSVMPYSSSDEAVRIANDTPYGLGAYLFTTSAENARSVGERLRAGRVFLNGAPSNAASPMGGYKQSGNGREMGVFGFEEYLETKAMFGFAA